MKYNIEKLTYKDLMIKLGKRDCNFEMQTLSEVIENGYTALIFMYNHDGTFKHGIQIHDGGYLLENWIYNVVTYIQQGRDYFESFDFEPIALILDGELVGCKIDIETTVILKK